MGFRDLEASEHVTWDEVGQLVEGTLLKIEQTTGRIKGKIAKLATEEGVRSVSCPTLLAQMLEDNWSDVAGKLVRITFVEQDKPKQKGQDGMKRFRVQVADEDA